MSKYHLLKTYDGAPYQVEEGDTVPMLWEADVDLFAFSLDICNGPECVDCGAAQCHHCNVNWQLQRDCVR